MIGSEISIRYESSRKIREGKGNDLRRDTDGYRGIIKRLSLRRRFASTDLPVFPSLGSRYSPD